MAFDRGPAVDAGYGGGDTGLQVASIFNAFGSRVEILEAPRRILLHADDDVAAAVAGAFRASGMLVRENFDAIESFEKTATGVRMNFSKGGRRDSAEATLAVGAVGSAADTAGLSLATPGIELNQRGVVKVENTCGRQRTTSSAPATAPPASCFSRRLSRTAPAMQTTSTRSATD